MPDPIIPDRAHDEAEELLPWYVTGQLEAPERERVEAHLAACAGCREELVLERRRMQALRSFSPQVESGWIRLRERIAVPASGTVKRRSTFGQVAADFWTVLTRPAVVALAAAQTLLLTIGISFFWLSQPTYQTLGSATAPAAANVIVMFEPGATEQDLRLALRDADGSIVGGPTAAGAYLIHVEPALRGKALASLQASRKVLLAQPIDARAAK